MSILNDTIQTHYFSSGLPGPHLLISAGVHGDEFEPMLATLKIIDLLPSILIAGSVTVVPATNPSADKLATRSGKDGLDLARTCPGKVQGLPTEKYAFQIAELIRTADFYIDMHTGGNLFDIHPLAGYLLHASRQVLEWQRQMAKAFDLPILWGTDPTPNGRTLSVARDAGIPSIYVEYGGGGAIRIEIVDAYVKGCLNVLNLLKMSKQGEAVASDPQYWVEDYLPESGHLQLKMPAPSEGIFSAAVKLGEIVHQGNGWGTITNVLTKSETRVEATSDGIVLFLRSFPWVKSGESLGGILPILKKGKQIIGHPENHMP